MARGLTGEGGAYISDRRASAEGAVRATRTCLTLSDWTCVLCREEWSATRRGEEGDKEGLLLKVISSTVNNSDDCYHVHALFKLEKVDRFVYCRIPKFCCSDEIIKRAQGLHLTLVYDSIEKRL